MKTMEELVELLRIEAGEVRLWIQEGWVIPGRTESGFLFQDADVGRVRLIRDLQEDLLFLNENIPVVLSLVDQIHTLRSQVRRLSEAVDRLPGPLREELMKHLAE